MKVRNKKHFITFLILILVITSISLPVTLFAADLPVDLKSTSSFAILAGSTITNTGTTDISGDAGGNIGLFPGTDITGLASVTTNGTVYASDPDGIASQAKTDLQTAYINAAGRTSTTTIVADLGGQTLTPGVYSSASGIGITGTLTLDAQGDLDAVFVFQAGSTLITASDSEVKLINGARYCRIFWQVGSSATLGTDSIFVGHIFAQESITLTTGASVQGQVLALNGAVTLDSNTIINGFCSEAKAKLKIKVIGAASDPDEEFIIQLTGTEMKTSAVLKNGESSEYIVIEPDITEGSLFSIVEIVPMEYQLTEISLVINAESGGTDPEMTGNLSSGYQIRVYPENDITIEVTNEYEQKSFFKAADSVMNEFIG